MRREHKNRAVERASRGLPKWIIPCVLLLCLPTGSAETDCDGCPEYCCEGTQRYCCSFSVYLNNLLSSGPMVSFVMFAVLLSAAALGALILCMSVCMHNSQGAPVADTTPDINLETRSHARILNSRPPALRTAPLRPNLDLMMRAAPVRQPPSYSMRNSNLYSTLPLYAAPPKKGARPIPGVVVTPPPISTA